MPEPGHGVIKRDFRYSTHPNPANLAYQPLNKLTAGLTRILIGCLPLLAPDAHIVLTARPWRTNGELIDLPGAIDAAAKRAGLRPVQRCVALLAGIDADRLITRASFFHRTAVARARAAGHRSQLICHEDVLIFAPAGKKPTSPHRPRHHRERPADRQRHLSIGPSAA